MKFCAERLKLIIEPTGCLALAGAIHSGFDLQHKKVGIIISGGNIDLKRYSELINNQI
mgnify:CR=1 FL=1